MCHVLGGAFSRVHAEDEVPTPGIDVADEKTIPTVRAELCFSAMSSFGLEVIFEVGAGFTGSKLSHDTWSGKIKLTETLSRYS